MEASSTTNYCANNFRVNPSVNSNSRYKYHSRYNYNDKYHSRYNTLGNTVTFSGTKVFLSVTELLKALLVV